MMTQTSNRWRKTLYAFATIPLFICLLAVFGNKGYAQSSENRTEVEENSLDTQLKTVTILWKDKDGTQVFKSYDKLSQAQKQKIKSLIPPPPPPREDQAPSSMKEIPVFPENSVIEYNMQNNTVRLIKDLNSIPPPPPPAPPTPLETAMDMAKNGGSFSLNGEMVNSEAAIAALKNNDNVKEVYIKKKTGNKRLMIITTKK